MKGRTLTGIVLVLGVVLGIVLVVSDRSISKLMEACGEVISELVGV